MSTHHNYFAAGMDFLTPSLTARFLKEKIKRIRNKKKKDNYRTNNLKIAFELY